ncbi:signal peptidase II [Myxococcota bacterium]
MKISWLKGKNLILAATVPLVLIADQVTKALAVTYLRPLFAEGPPSKPFVTVIDGFFHLKYAENAGAAWGLLRNASPTFRIPFFIIVSLLAIGLIIWFFRRIELHKKLLPLAVSLVLGGALGNLVDRVRMGKVVDFIDWFITIGGDEKHWPTFNVADAAITVGVVLLILEMFIGFKKEPAEGEG